VPQKGESHSVKEDHIHQECEKHTTSADERQTAQRRTKRSSRVNECQVVQVLGQGEGAQDLLQLRRRYFPTVVRALVQQQHQRDQQGCEQATRTQSNLRTRDQCL